MPPSVDPIPAQTNGHTYVDEVKPEVKELSEAENPLKKAKPELVKDYKFAHYLPTYDKSIHYPTLKPFEHSDPGLRVKPTPLTSTLPHLFPGGYDFSHGRQRQEAEGWQRQDLTPTIGTEIKGIGDGPNPVQLSQLTDEGKDELAVLVARRKVVAFRAQDFGEERDLNKVKEFGRHFGRLHIHPTSGYPEGHPEFHLVYRDGQTPYYFESLNRVSSVVWHSDVTYELQPPGTSFFWILDGPETGGDTVFVNMEEAYNRLSEPFKKLIEGLEAVHSGVEQAQHSREGKYGGGVVRRDPVEHTHPIVRTHPVTGARALFVNPGFTRRIVGFKREESDALLNFLFDHIGKGTDFQARVRWEPGTVAVWDNRLTVHTAIFDFPHETRRHASRLTPQAERPFFK